MKKRFGRGHKKVTAIVCLLLVALIIGGGVVAIYKIGGFQSPMELVAFIKRKLQFIYYSVF